MDGVRRICKTPRFGGRICSPDFADSTRRRAFMPAFPWSRLCEDHLMVAARYVAPNPVRPKLVAPAGAWPGRSFGVHLAVAHQLERCSGLFVDLLVEEAEPAGVNSSERGTCSPNVRLKATISEP